MDPSLKGSLAQATGNAAQIAFEASLMQYKLQGLAWGQRNHPETKFFGRNKSKVTGRAAPDYTAIIAPNRAIQLEVKTWQAKDVNTYSFYGKKGWQRQQQWMLMLDFAPFVPTFYLVLWRYKDNRDWRLHSPLFVPVVDTGLLFKRLDGVAVSEAGDGWPDWLKVVLTTYQA